MSDEIKELPDVERNEAQATVETTPTERFVIAEWKAESQRRKMWIEGYAAGGEFMLVAMIRARGLKGNFQISDDMTALIKVEEQDANSRT